MVCSVMNEQNNEKYIGKISQIITKWGGPLVLIFSYGLILGFAVIGLGLMASSTIFGILFGSGLLSGFGLLTGGVIFASGCSLVLRKLTGELDVFRQSLNKSETGAQG